MKSLAPLAAAIFLASIGCGETNQSCQDCPDLPRAGSGGAGGSGGGVGGMSAAGETHEEPPRPLAYCSAGGPFSRLQRRPLLDLEWSLQQLVSADASFSADAREGSGLRAYRSVTPAFVAALADVVAASATAASIDESELQPCEPDVVDRTGCIDSWIGQRGLHLYRRPLSAAQVSGYLEQFGEHSPHTSPVAAARSVLRAMILSPYFVFRVELGRDAQTQLLAAPPGLPAPIIPPGSPLSDHEIAARLAHFATRRAPDALLLAATARGEMQNVEGRLNQLTRLQQSPQGAQARVLQHLEWLRIEDQPVSQPSDAAALAEALLAQSSQFLHELLQDEAVPLRELLTRSRLPMNADLAHYYDIEGVTGPLGEVFEPVALEPTLYSGVLGLGAVLSRYPSPTRRGLFVIEDLQCVEFPEPPAGIGTDLPFMGDTPRERIMSVTQNQPCSVCHDLIDPNGFALEAFDARGRLTGFDTTGALRVDNNAQAVPVANPSELGHAIADSREARLCAAQRYYEHLLDRPAFLNELSSVPSGPANGLDPAWIECLASAFNDGDVDLNHLAKVVVGSDAISTMDRAPLSGEGLSAAVDPYEHAIQETQTLAEAFTEIGERGLLDEYAASLRAVQDLKPFE